MKPIYNLTEAEVSRAEHLRCQGFSWQRISKALGYGREVIQRAIDPDFSARRHIQRMNYRTNTNDCRVMSASRKVEPSAKALAEREFAFMFERDTTGELCGDPRPGRSALDKR